MKKPTPLFRRRPTVFAMIHLAPLPGSPDFAGSMSEVLRKAERDAEVLVDQGVDGLIVENFGDVPFFLDRVPPVTTAAIAIAVARLRERFSKPRVPIGVNVLRNDARAALSVAAAADADFVRINVHVGAAVTDQGLVQGRAAETMRLRAEIAPQVRVFADLRVKHSAPLASFALETEIADLAERGRADAVLVTGPRTGAPPERAMLEQVRASIGKVPLVVASGVTVDNAPELASLVDGMVVGSSLKRGGRVQNPVDAVRVARFMKSLNR
jgi:hypothetical protein